MVGNELGIVLGEAKAVAVSGRGFTPEEITDQALTKILYVGQSCHPAIKDQAEAFREQIRSVILSATRQAVRSNHTTLANKFRAAGYPELVKLLEG